MNAKQKLQNRIKALTTSQIEAALVVINKAWDKFTKEELIVRVAMLNEYEQRNGGEMVDALMDKLEATA
jgi:hypothetical protein|tara:strand:+ start:348 stop:554 length:207 start_codon:yes stop_codon:yes gene_type:complete